jgi:hypothetical protein
LRLCNEILPENKKTGTPQLGGISGLPFTAFPIDTRGIDMFASEVPLRTLKRSFSYLLMAAYDLN